MKSTYTRDLSKQETAATITLQGWVKGKRMHKKVVFLDIMDSTGAIQVVINDENQELFQIANKMKREAAVEILLRRVGEEWTADSIQMIGDVTHEISPHPRGDDINIFSSSNTDHLLRNRHLYIRNPKVMAILKFRDMLMMETRKWFYENHFTSIDAPILTPVPLYNDSSAMGIEVHGEKLFLTQCVGYYLEAAVMAFERVYNIGPSFRNEESKSKRHLSEYWHIKAEACFGDLEDVITMVENLFVYLTGQLHNQASEITSTLGTSFCMDGMKAPFQRISYVDAIDSLKAKGFEIEFGKGLGSEEEEALSKEFDGPFWVVGIPRIIEPFPYCIDSDDVRVTRTADLIASNGFGELLGVAEKIYNYEELKERMIDKERWDDERFNWIKEVHQIGCVPHVAFGMGVERLIRWMLNIPHVRDAIPFPRVFGRKVYP